LEEQGEQVAHSKKTFVIDKVPSGVSDAIMLGTTSLPVFFFSRRGVCGGWLALCAAHTCFAPCCPALRNSSLKFGPSSPQFDNVVKENNLLGPPPLLLLPTRTAGGGKDKTVTVGFGPSETLQALAGDARFACVLAPWCCVRCQQGTREFQHDIFPPYLSQCLSQQVSCT